MRRFPFRWFILIVLLLTLLLSCLPGHAEEEYLSTISFRMTASLIRGENNVRIVDQPGGKTAVATLKQGDTCRILGYSGNYYRVSFQNQTGYILQKKLALKGQELSKPLKEEHLSDLKLEDYIPRRSEAEALTLTGTIRSENKLNALYFFVWNARLLKVESALMIPITEPADTIPVSSLKKKLTTPGVTAGRKLLVIEGVSGDTTTVLFRTLYSVRGNTADPAHVTGMCTVSNQGVLSESLTTGWKVPNAKTALTVEIPEKAKASLITMEWRKPPEAFTVELYGEKDNLLSAETRSTGFYIDAQALTEDVRKVKIFAKGENVFLTTLRVYPQRYAQHAVQEWQPLPDKVDVMAVSAHQDDELLFLGGTVPYACAKGKAVAMVYMTNGGRERYREALDGMWTAGLRYHPIFVHWRDAKVSSLSATENIWKNNYGADPRIYIVRLIRRYRPDVVVTQDLNGEYGHNQHKLTAILWSEAVKLSKDESYDPASVKQYGAWEVKKMYIHLYAENQITMDWDMPLNNGTPFTPIMLAKEAFDRHRSQQAAFNMDKHGVWYNNRLFGLYYTAVGPDVKKNDFFENLPAD
ncbi:MAG: PIG-L family deacetylase [Clostridia bacterium]|nr:PIG-L family deacetylase [Clostridia bacterium]MBR1585617.1 PIG-L family deacetylase [Clostridia bacterium]